MPTIHIEAEKEDIAPLVIMPGDPNRCTYIAENYLEDYKLVNKVRGELAYTGTYKGKKVTIFSSGMGIPSMGIYSHELFKEYNVEAIIRIGSTGSYVSDVKINDIFLVTDAFTDSNYAKVYTNNETYNALSDSELNDIIKNTAKENDIILKEGVAHSSVAFYTNGLDTEELVRKYNTKVVEMESFALLLNANFLHKKASCLLTVSDSFVTNEHLSKEEREVSFNNMIMLALESIIKL